ncbi:MAG: hypothetical protein N3D73_00785 [Candidatus Diapherotrites archaeon]|nr:hypothetical protein [Candidatus Diapherotrites archaeon]
MKKDLVFIDNLESLKLAKDFFGLNSFIIAKDLAEKEIFYLKERSNSLGLNLEFCKIVNSKEDCNKKYKNFDYLGFRPNNIESLNYALRREMFDFIIHPFSKDFILIDSALARVGKENDLTFVFLFSEFFGLNDKERALLTKNSIISFSFLSKFKCKVKFFSGARDLFELRDPECLESLADFFFLDRECLD